MAIPFFTLPSSISFGSIQASGRKSITSDDYNNIVADLNNIAASVSVLATLLGTTCIRVSLTGTAYTVPANVGVIRFVQNVTIASQVVNLPVSIGDGQVLQFMNYTNAISSMTFSPAVVGWSNTSSFSAPTGIRIRWDATANAWYREG